MNERDSFAQRILGARIQDFVRTQSEALHAFDDNDREDKREGLRSSESEEGKQKLPSRRNHKAGEIKRLPEARIVIIESKQRGGKTLTGAILAKEAQRKGRKVFSIIPFEFPHELIRFSDLRPENAPKFRGSFVYIDELNFFFDARESMTIKNRKAGRFFLQLLKQGIILVGTTHELDYLDFRLTDNYDLRFNVRVFPEFPEVPERLEILITNGPNIDRRISKTFALDPHPFLGIYDTTYVVNEDDWKESPKENATKKKSAKALRPTDPSGASLPFD